MRVSQEKLITFPCVWQQRKLEYVATKAMSHTITTTLADMLYCLFVVFESYAGHIGTDRSLLIGHDALLLQQIAGDLLHALSHRCDNTWHCL